MSVRQRLWRGTEFLLLFGLAPAGLWVLKLVGRPVPVFVLLAATGVLALLYLLFAAPGQLRAGLARPCGRPELLRLGLQIAVAGALLALFVRAWRPDWFLDLPLRRPSRWLLFLGLYPLLSVIPQELLFRAFLFHRYGALLRSPTACVLASSAAFGLAHAFYGSWLVVGLSTLGGIAFAWTFVRTGSLSLVVLEHSLYGILLFTLGLGRLFTLGAGA